MTLNARCGIVSCKSATLTRAHPRTSADAQDWIHSVGSCFGIGGGSGFWTESAAAEPAAAEPAGSEAARVSEPAIRKGAAAPGAAACATEVGTRAAENRGATAPHANQTGRSAIGARGYARGLHAAKRFFGRSHRYSGARPEDQLHS